MENLSPPRLRAGPPGGAWWLSPWVLIAGFVMLLAAGVIALWLVQQARQHSHWVRQSIETREAATLLLSVVHEAESGQRGFLLTGDQRYLEPYNRAVQSLHAALDRIRTLIADRPEQHPRLAKLQELAAEKLAELDQTLELAKKGQFDRALAIVNTDRGEVLMREIRTVVAGFVVAESQKLLERQEQAARSREWLTGTILAAIAAAAALAFLSIMLAKRNLDALAAGRAELERLNEELEERVALRTRELESARERAEAEAARAEHERSRVELLLRDATHRVGNNLAMVSALLGLQMKRITSVEARTALEAARSRIQAISSAERRLRLGDDLQSTRADELLEAVVSDTMEAVTGGERIAVQCDFKPLVIASRDTTTLAVALGELVRNAMKHGFPDGRGGTIKATFEIGGDGVPALAVTDNGVGLADGADLAETGLGSTIIDNLARQYGGEATRRPVDGGGTMVRISLPGLAIKGLEPCQPPEERPALRGGRHAL